MARVDLDVIIVENSKHSFVTLKEKAIFHKIDVISDTFPSKFKAQLFDFEYLDIYRCAHSFDEDLWRDQSLA